jgi:hypothetical protein
MFFSFETQNPALSKPTLKYNRTVDPVLSGHLWDKEKVVF